MFRITAFVASMGLFFLGAAPRASAEPIRIFWRRPIRAPGSQCEGRVMSSLRGGSIAGY